MNKDIVILAILQYIMRQYCRKFGKVYSLQPCLFIILPAIKKLKLLELCSGQVLYSVQCTVHVREHVCVHFLNTFAIKFSSTNGFSNS